MILNLKVLFWINDFEYLYMTWISYIFMKAINVPGHIVEIGCSGRNSIIFGKFLEISSENLYVNILGLIHLPAIWMIH